MVKSLTKAAFKTITKGLTKEALPVIGKELTEQTFKNLDVTAREAVSNLGRYKTYQNLALESQQAISNHLEKLPSNEILPESKAIDSIFQKIEGTDPELQNIGWKELDDVDHGLRAINHASHETNKLLAKNAEVKGKPNIDPSIYKNQLDTFIAETQQSLSSAPTGMMKTGEGLQETKLWPGTAEELLASAEKYINLREQLHKQGVKGYAQSRSGWQEIFGNILDEDGYPMRLSGGTRSSGGRKLTLKSQKSSMNRKAGLRSFKGDFKGETKRRGWEELNLEGHHWETAAKEADVFSSRELPDGTITRRSAEDLAYIDETLENLNMRIGDKSKNLTGLTKPAHMGAGLEEADKILAAHETPKAAYDFEGFRDWQVEASEVYVQLPPRKNGKNPRYVWYKNVNGQLFTKRGNTPVKLPKKAKKLAFKMEGSPGTYAIGQRHGFTQEFVQQLRRIEDPELIIEAIKTYYEAGIPDLRKGTSALANLTLQPDAKLDSQSSMMMNEAVPQMLQVMNDLKKLPAYQNSPKFVDKLNELEEVAKELQETVQATPPIPGT
jgi:hypothetical protein